MGRRRTFSVEAALSPDARVLAAAACYNTFSSKRALFLHTFGSRGHPEVNTSHRAERTLIRGSRGFWCRDHSLYVPSPWLRCGGRPKRSVQQIQRGIPGATALLQRAAAGVFVVQPIASMLPRMLVPVGGIIRPIIQEAASIRGGALVEGGNLHLDRSLGGTGSVPPRLLSMSRWPSW